MHFKRSQHYIFVNNYYLPSIERLAYQINCLEKPILGEYPKFGRKSANVSLRELGEPQLCLAADWTSVNALKDDPQGGFNLKQNMI